MKKWINYEYFLGFLLAFGLWGYHLINISIISQNIANKNNFNYYGLEESYIGFKRDLTDFQWRNFRNSIGIIFLFASIFLILSNIVKRYMINYLKIYYLLIGLGYAIYLHRIKIIFLIIILLINFKFKRYYKYLGKTLYIALTWFYCCLFKILSEIYHGFTFKSYLDIDESSEIGWESVFGLIILRMISFNIEFKSSVEKNSVVQHTCEECAKNNHCLKYMSNIILPVIDFSLINYIIYIFYPPLYFSGPIISFNSFIYQINKQDRNNLTRDKIIYFIRYIFVFICFEIFNSLIYVNLYLTSQYTNYIVNEFDYYTISAMSFFLLIFIWFKFTVIWRTARVWSWFDGILTVENMNRCMYNNYCFEGFWRAWHKSFNDWLIKYIYIPLGGSNLKLINIWIVFSFVALWHDLKLNLLLWGWFICFFLIPEILIKSYFNKRKYYNNYFIFRIFKYFGCSIYIVLMIIANLIGFGMGHDSLYQLIIRMLTETSILYIFKILIFLMPSVIVMFYVREKEGNKNF